MSVAQVNSASDSTASTPKPRREVYALGRFGTYRYARPRLLAPLRDVPGDFIAYARHTAHPRSLPALGGVIAATALLLPVDQPAVNGARQFATFIGLDHSSEQHDLLASEGQSTLKLAIRYPATLNSAFYYVGEGSPSLLTAAGMWGFGLIRRDNRALATASQLVENALVTGVMTQLLKRCAGRESPRVSTERGGRWDFFPNLRTYQQHVPLYDAFPSGHLTTLTATFTTLAENYPEKRWLYPLGGVVVGACGFAMMNVGVHWASDYPLALALGYSYARLNARRHRTRLDAPLTGAARRAAHPWRFPTLTPTVLAGGAAGAVVSWRL